MRSTMQEPRQTVLHTTCRAELVVHAARRSKGPFERPGSIGAHASFCDPKCCHAATQNAVRRKPRSVLDGRRLLQMSVEPGEHLRGGLQHRLSSAIRVTL